MQVKNWSIGLSIAALVGAGLVAACGPVGGEPGPGSGPKKCAANGDCTSGKEICHPVGKVCVPTCNAGADCPANQKNCAPVKDAAGKETTEKVCQCATSELCKGDDKASKLVCSTVDNVCETACAADGDCSGFNNRKCDTAKTFCVVKEAPKCTKDADCTDTTKPKCNTTTGACEAAVKCTANTDCAKDTTKPLCDTASGACIAKCTTNTDCKDTAKPSCDTATGLCTKCDASKGVGTNLGPDFCKYGEYCGATGACVNAKATETCDAAKLNKPNNNAKSPVVWGVALTGTTRIAAAGATCAGKTIHKFEGKFYDLEGDVAIAKSYQSITWIRNDGTNPGGGGNTYEKTTIAYNADAKSGSFSFELCEDLKGKAQGVTLFDNAGNESNVACYTF